jgi:hypothetical protein
MLWKRLLSYRKPEWDFEDYPIRVRVQTDVPEGSRYWARILGWNIDGLGRTRADALSELEKYYEMRKASRAQEGEPAPRPGTAVPLKFASQQRVHANDELMEDFIHRVLDLPWAFISDESSLWDFHLDESGEALIAKIRDVYGVDVSDIASGNIAEILERIAAERLQ